MLATSGIGGVYPPGLPVGRVAHIEYDRSHKFARIICVPVAGVDRHRQVLVLIGSVPTPEISDNPESYAPQKTGKPRITEHDYVAQEFSLPARRSLVYLNLIMAVLVNLMPFDKVILVLRPDFVALTLLYWNIHQPQQAGMGIAFLCGLVMDVVDTSIMGQHAIAYCLMTFLP